MTKPSLTELSAKEYAETMHLEWGEWRSRDAFLLYTHPAERYRIIREHHTEPGYGYDRREAMADAGLYDAHIDAKAFADEFVATVGQHMSLRDLGYFIAALAKFRDDWEAERQAHLAKQGG